MFRSEPMQHGTIIIPAERARDFIELLGTRCHVQFVDMNEKSMIRPYKRYIERIEEMERVLKFLFKSINKLPNVKVVPVDVASFFDADLGYELKGVEEALQTLRQHFENFCENNSILNTERDSALEELALLKVAQSSYAQDTNGKVLASVPNLNSTSNDKNNNSLKTNDNDIRENYFTNIAGVMAASDQEHFSRTLFRATRGNAFCYFELLNDSNSTLQNKETDQKTIFVTYFQGSVTGESALREKIIQLCNAFYVRFYEWPKSYEEAETRITQLNDIIADKTKALEAYEDFFLNEVIALLEVHRVGGGSLIEEYRLFCLKEKAVYTTLNFFEGTDTLRAFCWFPEAQEESIRRFLMSLSKPNQASAFLLKDKHRRKQDMPPTYIPTTEFTEVFHCFVNTYGVPRYQEINPAIYTIVTFPFLFGIMYGDIGHGICLLAFALVLLFMWDKLKKTKDEIVLLIGSGRYMIFLMSVFAVYCGLLYNDFFALGLNLFGSKYIEVKSNNPEERHFDLKDPDVIYPFGVDPIWKGATNELIYLNSFKMKFSVVIGASQMSLGIVLKVLNDIYFNDMITLVFETIPQIVFFVCFIGYMCFLILYKWLTPRKIPDNKPLIVSTIIDMFGAKDVAMPMFSGQGTIQKVFLFLLLASMPIMLCMKPIILIVQHYLKKRPKEDTIGSPLEENDYTVRIENMESMDENIGNDSENEEFSVLDIVIYQLIETIEFCLDCLSNTASYLRLWALSLAHQQLSLVFFQMTLQKVLEKDFNVIVMGILLFFVFAVFAFVTLGVMLCMDTLECFLHALRLQWVEFQSKFYKADGYIFVPFRLEKILEVSE